MAADAVPAAVDPPRPGWLGLLWTIPFTAEDGLIYSLSVVPGNGLPSVHALECYPC